jgi:hypothetical protein
LGWSLSIVFFYLAIMVFASDWRFAVDQLEECRWRMVALSAGPGIQVTLFVRFK